jgi:hypothetical protein
VLAAESGFRYELADDRLADGLRILAGLDLPGRCE